ncbi:FKBP-type peptidyl-prolyl cis-trans isomerase [Martelella endophytica]|uniref:Peptidyl-prolyl cis-trans isomerase n=1 Tax=Martelella endophytica TaxID=1486262 RepID=A0A0D5LKN4_MAREN|nr:peptidylprolyl isomerase [Martelella endophytica]AJY44721.1 peptidylprolyl isomerase [Martelella endophytica]
MAEAKSGDTVRIHYTGTLNDGSMFDSSQGRQPLEFTVGAGQIIPGLDREIAGMNVGDSRAVQVPAAEAYGDHDPQKVQVVPRSAMPQEMEITPGMQLQARTPNGETVPLIVTKVEPEEVTVDANHPLAGQDLNFAVELVEIVKAA